MLSPLVKAVYVLIDDGSVCTEGWGECIKAIDVANRQKRKRDLFFKHEPLYYFFQAWSLVLLAVLLMMNKILFKTIISITEVFFNFNNKYNKVQQNKQSKAIHQTIRK